MKAYREGCAWVFVAAKPMGWKVGPVVIDVEYRWHRKAPGAHPADLDNAVACCKAGLDSMVDAGIIANDSKKWLSWGAMTLLTTEREVTKAGGPGVFVTVRRV